MWYVRSFGNMVGGEGAGFYSAGRYPDCGSGYPGGGRLRHRAQLLYSTPTGSSSSATPIIPAASFKTGVERHIASLAAAIRAFVSASHDVSRWEFSALRTRTLPRNSGFKGGAVAAACECGPAQRLFERNMQRDGLFGLQLRELTASERSGESGRPVLLSSRRFVEPFEGSSSLIGVDLSHNPIYAPLFEAARKSGRAAVSAPIDPRAGRNKWGSRWWWCSLSRNAGAPTAGAKPVSRRRRAGGLCAGRSGTGSRDARGRWAPDRVNGYHRL